MVHVQARTQAAESTVRQNALLFLVGCYSCQDSCFCLLIYALRAIDDQGRQDLSLKRSFVSLPTYVRIHSVNKSKYYEIR